TTTLAAALAGPGRRRLEHRQDAVRRPEADLDVLLEEPAEERRPAATAVVEAAAAPAPQENGPLLALAARAPQDFVAVGRAAQGEAPGRRGPGAVGPYFRIARPLSAVALQVLAYVLFVVGEVAPVERVVDADEVVDLTGPVPADELLEVFGEGDAEA